MAGFNPIHDKLDAILCRISGDKDAIRRDKQRRLKQEGYRVKRNWKGKRIDKNFDGYNDDETDAELDVTNIRAGILNGSDEMLVGSLGGGSRGMVPPPGSIGKLPGSSFSIAGIAKPSVRRSRRRRSNHFGEVRESSSRFPLNSGPKMESSTQQPQSELASFPSGSRLGSAPINRSEEHLDKLPRRSEVYPASKTQLPQSISTSHSLCLPASRQVSNGSIEAPLCKNFIQDESMSNDEAQLKAPLYRQQDSYFQPGGSRADQSYSGQPSDRSQVYSQNENEESDGVETRDFAYERARSFSPQHPQSLRRNEQKAEARSSSSAFEEFFSRRTSPTPSLLPLQKYETERSGISRYEMGLSGRRSPSPEPEYREPRSSRRERARAPEEMSRGSRLKHLGIQSSRRQVFPDSQNYNFGEDYEPPEESRVSCNDGSTVSIPENYESYEQYRASIKSNARRSQRRASPSPPFFSQRQEEYNTQRPSTKNSNSRASEQLIGCKSARTLPKVVPLSHRGSCKDSSDLDSNLPVKESMRRSSTAPSSISRLGRDSSLPSTLPSRPGITLNQLRDMNRKFSDGVSTESPIIITERSALSSRLAAPPGAIGDMNRTYLDGMGSNPNPHKNYHPPTVESYRSSEIPGLQPSPEAIDNVNILNLPGMETGAPSVRNTKTKAASGDIGLIAKNSLLLVPDTGMGRYLGDMNRTYLQGMEIGVSLIRDKKMKTVGGEVGRSAKETILPAPNTDIGRALGDMTRTYVEGLEEGGNQKGEKKNM